MNAERRDPITNKLWKGSEMMTGLEIEKLAWRKSGHSKSANDCVEAAPLPGGGAAVRDSKNPDGAVLSFTAGEWTAFTAGVRGGEFDF